MATLFEEILSSIVESGRLQHWNEAELEAEVQFEASERGLDDATTAEAVAWALAHTELKG